MIKNRIKVIKITQTKCYDKAMEVGDPRPLV